MTTANNTFDWQRLSAEFDPADVSFRIQSTYERNGKTQAVCVAYIDARNVADRLDSVCGPDGWSFDWQPVVTTSSAVMAAKGTLTIAGISKSDVGDAGQTEPTKASVSDALKRSAVLWGIGRYLYSLPMMHAEVEKRGNSWVLAHGEEDRLRAKLPSPDGSVAHPQSTQSTWQKRPPVLAAPTPPKPPVNIERHEDEPATPEQQERMRKAREVLGITDKSIIATDNRLRFAEAEARIATYLAQHARNHQLQGPAQQRARA